MGKKKTCNRKADSVAKVGVEQELIVLGQVVSMFVSCFFLWWGNSVHTYSIGELLERPHFLPFLRENPYDLIV